MNLFQAKLNKNPNLVHNFYYSFILSFINGAVNVLYPLVVGILIGPIKYSFFAYLLAIINLSILLNESFLVPSTIRFVSTAIQEKKDQIYSSIWSIYFSFLITVFIIFIFAHSLLNIDAFLDIMIFSILLIFITLHRYVKSIYQGLELYSHLVKIEIISLTIGVFFGLIQLFNYSFYQQLFFPLIVYHFSFIILSIFSYDIFKFKLDFNMEVIKKILRYGFFSGMGSIISLGLNQYQIIFTSIKFSNLSTGQIAFWTYLTFPFTIFSLSLLNAIFPRMVKLSIKDQARVYNIITSLIKNLILISILLVILLNLCVSLAYDLKIHFLTAYFSGNGVKIASLYLITGGGLIIFYSLSPLFSIYENRIFVNSLLPFILLTVAIIIWNLFINLEDIIIPIGFLIAVIITTIASMSFAFYFEKIDIELFGLFILYYAIEIILNLFGIIDSIFQNNIGLTLFVIPILILLILYSVYRLLVFLRKTNSYLVDVV